MYIIVIIPAYNEAQKIYRVVRSVSERGYEVLVVDDGSNDDTAAEAERAGARVVRHLINRGYGAALTTGNEWAVRHGYGVAVHFDADGQHNPEDIERLVAPIVEGKAEVVLGSRFLSPLLFEEGVGPAFAGGFGEARGGVPLIRKFLLKAAILFTWFVSGIKLTDAHNGLRAFSRLALQKIDCRQDGMSYASEVIDQIAEHGLHFLEVPVTVQYTDYSLTKGESNVKKVLLGVKFIWGKMIK